MSSRAGSVRLRSALGKMDQADNTASLQYGSSTALPTTSEKASRSSRRTTNGHHTMNGGFNNGNGSSTSTSTRSQSRTRGSSISGGGGTTMEVDVDENCSASGSVGVSSTVVTESTSSVNCVSDSNTNNGGGGGGNTSSNNSGNKGVSGAGNNNGSSTNSNANNNEASKSTNDSAAGADSNSMDVDESSSESTSSDSSDSSDSEDSSEMDEQSSELKKQQFQSDLSDFEKQFQYLRELLYHERMAQITAKLEEVRSGKAKEYLGPLAQLQENMRTRMEVTANLRQFRLVNVQHKFEAEELAIRQNYESEKQLLYDSIKSDSEEKIRRLEEDRNNDFTSELWLETALKRKNKKSIDIFGDKKKKPVAVSGPYLVYMLNDVDIVEDWTAIKKAIAAPKRKHVEMVY